MAFRLPICVRDVYRYQLRGEGLGALITCMLILADGDDAERAVMLYSSIQKRFPPSGFLLWGGTDIDDEMAAAMESLPSDMATKAYQRGKQLDLWMAANELLEELASLGWNS